MATPKLAFKPLKKKPVRKAPDFFSSKKKKKVPTLAVNVAKNKKKTPNKQNAADTKNELKTKSILEIQKSKVAKVTKTQKKHDAPSQKVKEAQKAVFISPALEKSSKAKSNQVNDMAEQKPKKFDAVKFSDEILSNIKKVIPKDQKEMENDKTSSEKMGESQQTITDTLDKEKDNAGGDIRASVSATPDESGIAVKETAPLPPENIGAAPTLPGAGFAPPLKTPQDTDLSADSKKIDNKLASNNVSENQLQNANEPSFSKGLDDKKASQANAAQTHQQYLIQAAPTVNATKSGTQSVIEGGISGMHTKRTKQLSAVDKKKELKKQEEEQTRKNVAEELDKIYTGTKGKVDTILKNLTNNVNTIFDIALSTANKVFEENVDRRTDVSWYEKIANWAAGIPNDMAVIFKEEQDNFINNLKPIVVRIGQLVEGELTKAANETEAGRKATQDYWNKQSDETKKIAGDLFEGATDKFSELDAQIEQSSDSLKESITTKFNDAVSKLEETFEKIKDANKSWLERAYDAVVGIINAILEMKDLLFNVLRKAANVIGQIIGDPIGFLGNLLSAISLGFTNFRKNFLEHLKRGFFEWLLGSMPPSIKFPKQWDLKGIFEFVMSILGLTVENIKDRVAKMYGPTVVKLIEGSFTIFLILQKDGIAGLWEYIKEQLNNLKEMAIDAIQDMLKMEIIEAAISWLIGLFNPVGAFIKACQLIYKVVTWFFNNAKKIILLLDRIVDSMALIVAGDLTGAANYIEDALGRTVPIIIGFLAALINLGDLSKKVQKILDKIREPINKAIDWVLKKSGDIIKGLVKAAKTGVNKLMAWLGLKKKFQANDGKTHTLYFGGSEDNPVLMVASDPRTYHDFLQGVLKNHKDKTMVSDALKKAAEIDTIKGAPYKSKEGEELKSEKQERIDKIKPLLEELSKITAPFFGNLEKGEVTHEIKSEGGIDVGKRVFAKHLSKLGRVDGEKGSPPSQEGLLWDALKERTKGGGSYYIRGHLLNHNIFGQGKWINMAPITRRANSSMESQIENKAKKYVQTGGSINFEVKCIYGRSAPAIVDGDSDKIKEVKKKEVFVPEYLTASLWAKTEETGDDYKPIYENEEIKIDINDEYLAEKKPKKIFHLKNHLTVEALTGSGIPQANSEKIHAWYVTNKHKEITDYENQTGKTKKELLGYIVAKDSTYTEISQD